MTTKLRPYSLYEQPVQINLLVAAIVLCLGLQAWLAVEMEINWDEFYFLSLIYDFQRASLVQAMQTFHVHVLGWVTAIPGNEISQIQVGRVLMLACFTGTCALIYAIARCFVSPIAGLLAVLIFASAGYSVIHGASFRADPIAAFLMMAALAVLALARLGLAPALAAGLLTATAALITVKVALYAPALLGIALWRVVRAEDKRKALIFLASCALAAAVFAVSLYLLHLSLVPKATNATVQANMGNAAATQVSAGILPRTKETLQFAFLSPLQTVLILTGAGIGFLSLRNQDKRIEAIAILGCGGTLLCLLLYRNAFPYFFPFILAPAAVLAGWAVEQLGILKKHALLIGIGMVVPAVAIAAKWSTHERSGQEVVIENIHQIFPHPIAYIDRNSMVASFPKVGFFMSTWGMQNYRRAGKPVFASLLAEQPVPLIIVNGPALQNAFGEFEQLSPDLTLLSEDKATLRDHYIHHWGPLWVAGKTLVARPEGTLFDIVVPGTYTLEEGAAAIDGLMVEVGQSVRLDRGEHTISTPNGQQVTLRWGENLARPQEPFAGPIYRGF